MQPFEVLVCEQLLAEAQRFLAGAAPPASVAAAPHSDAAAAELSAAHAALAPIYKEAQSVGLQLLPLRSPADVLRTELTDPQRTVQG